MILAMRQQLMTVRLPTRDDGPLARGLRSRSRGLRPIPSRHAARLGMAIVLGTALLPGCYLSFRLGDDDPPNPPDGGDDVIDPPDGDVPWDAPITDAGSDAAVDGGPDAGPDIEPDPGPPPIPGVCRTEPPIAPFDGAVLETSWPDDVSLTVHTAARHVVVTPLVIDLDPTDDTVQPQIIFSSYVGPNREDPRPGGILRIWDPQEGTTLSYPADSAEPGVLEFSGNLAAGDLDGDGVPEVVGIGNRAGTYAFRADGTLLWQSFYPTALDRGTENPSFGGAPLIADLEGDGNVEVVVGRSVLAGSDGALLWNGVQGETTKGVNVAFVGPISCVADLDDDGDLEVIAGPTVFQHDGTVTWTRSGENIDGSCGVADVMDDHDGLEILMVSRGFIRLLDPEDGATLWERRLEGGTGFLGAGGPPTVADYDGDGRPEFAAANGGAYTVLDLDCEGAGVPAGCVGEGVLWSSTTEDESSSSTGSSVFDFNGDGRAEVVYNDQFNFRIYDGRNGQALFTHRNSSRTRTEYPVIADADNDGDAEIVFSANAEASGLLSGRMTDPGVEIWGDRRGRWVGARRIWNQHAYHPSFVNEDGSIPASPEAPWSFLNAFRQNIREDRDVLATPDLWGGRGDYTCGDDPDQATLVIDVQNFGLERSGAGVGVGIYRGFVAPENRVTEVVTSQRLDPGDNEVLTVEVELGDDPRESWVAVLDDPIDPPGGAVAECREDNNEVVIWRPSCPRVDG